MVCNFMAHKKVKGQKAKSQALFLAVFIVFSLTVFAQSGRNKAQQEEEKSKPKIIFVPSVSVQNVPTPTPTPISIKTPKPTPEQDDVIRIDSTLVPIPVSVTDSSLKAVLDLKLEDFELKIDGSPAEISDISRSELPVRLAFLFDNSSSVIQAREFEKKSAIKFFRKVIRPNKDLASLFSISTGTRLEQVLTKDVSSLVYSIENLPEPAGATALFDGVIKAAKYLENIEGRRVIVIMSDGEDTISDATLEETVKILQLTNCQIYVVKTTDFETFKRDGERTSNANVRSLAAERRMQELALQTGGAVYSPIDERELDAAFFRISNELSSQFILSYYPSDDQKRNVFHNISLNVKNRENLVVRTRKGYLLTRK
jgi:Ca-activated chloride channel homolog